MNEREFAQHILKTFRSDKTVEAWYKKFMHGTDYSETETRIVNAIENKELTPLQAVQLGIFIGLTTKTN